MHFLIATTNQGNKLIDFGDEVLRLKAAMMDLLNENSSTVHSAIMNEKMVKDVFLCDEFGIPVKDEGYLIRLDDI